MTVDEDRHLRLAALARNEGLIDEDEHRTLRAEWSEGRSPSMAALLSARCGVGAGDLARLAGLLDRLDGDSLAAGQTAAPTLADGATARGRPGSAEEPSETVPATPPASVGAPAPLLGETVDLAEVGPTLAATRTDGSGNSASEPSATEPLATAPLAETSEGERGFDRLARIDQQAGDSKTRYTLTHLHARGGIGQVWLARDEDFGREVALKELRPDRDVNSASEARFVAEARITGQLEHPGIVPVYELRDRPDGGRPYYTMRFVRGRTLTDAIHEYHDRRRAGEAGPLELATLLNAFVAVGHAVAYAHSRGVIHRDLKGQNIILGDFGEVMVLDWGLAKLVDRADDPSAMPPVAVEDLAACGQTVAGRALGTPAYMAPEQAEGRLEDIGPLSDVYGLGAVLYEVLAGQPPFEAPRTTEILRKVVHEPPRPPREINRDAPPALEAVCLRALEKAPGRRYPSAEALTAEVRRWLADEPVSAYREPWPDRLARWTRRHRTLAAATGSLLLTAVVGLAVGTVLVGRERDAARAQRAVARQSVDDMYTQVAERWLEDRLDPLQEEFLRKALAYYERFAAEDSAAPALRRERGRAYQRLGDIYRKLGRRDEAERALRRSSEVLGRLASERRRDPESLGELADTRRRLGVVLADRGAYDEADGEYRAALATQESLAGESGSRPEARLRLARTLKNRGDLFRLRGDLAAAEASYGRAREALDALRRSAPRDFAARQDLAVVCDALGMLLKERGRDGEAESVLREALAVQDALVAEAPTSPSLREALGKTCNSLALLLSRAGRSDEEERLLKRQREVYERLATDFPARPEYRRELARSHVNLGLLLFGRGRSDEAEPVLRRAIALDEPLTRSEPQVLQYRLDLGKCRFNLGRLLQASGRPAEAEETLGAARAIYETLHAEHPEAPRHREALAGTLLALGDLASASGRPEADALYEQSTGHYEDLVARYPDNAEYRQGLARCLNNRGIFLAGGDRKDEARGSYRRALDLYRSLARGEAPSRDLRRDLAACLNNLGELRQDGAEAAYREAVALGESLGREASEVPSYRQELASYRNNLGECLAGLDGRENEADGEFRSAADLFERLTTDYPKVADYHSLAGYVLENLGNLRLRGKRDEEARVALEAAVRHQRQAVAADRRNSLYRSRLTTHLAALAEADMALGTHERAARVAAELPGAAPSRPQGCYDAARLLARCASKAEGDESLSADHRRLLAESYGNRAVALLQEAADSDRTIGRRAAGEPDFRPLESRDVYRALIQAPESADGAGPG